MLEKNFKFLKEFNILLVFVLLWIARNIGSFHTYILYIDSLSLYIIYLGRNGFMFRSSGIHLRKKARNSFVQMSLAHVNCGGKIKHLSLSPFSCYRWHIVSRERTEKQIRTSEVSIDPLPIAATFIAIRRIVRKLFCQ